MKLSTLLLFIFGIGFLEGALISRYFKQKPDCDLGSPLAAILNESPEVSGCIGYNTQPHTGMTFKRGAASGVTHGILT